VPILFPTFTTSGKSFEDETNALDLLLGMKRGFTPRVNLIGAGVMTNIITQKPGIKSFLI
jgi:hypothetical protein